MDLAQKLIKYAGHTLFYVTLDPERALGIEDILPNYTIICPYKSALTNQLRKDGVDVLVLEENMPLKKVEEIIERGTYGILQSEFARNTIESRCAEFNSAHIMVLKNSGLIEDFCKKQGWKLLAPKASIAEKFENKISQYKLLRRTAPYPKSFITTLDKLSESGPDNIGARLRIGIPLVLQFNRGHSGNGTFFVNSRGDIKKLHKLFPKREAKVSEYIKGETYTLNCLLLKNGKILTGSLSKQITGLPSATNNPNTTVGNDFEAAGRLGLPQLKKIQKIAQNISKEMYKKRYSGLFGIDVIMEKDSGKIYFIELNTHQPASVSFEAKLHRKIGKIPLLAYFVLDNFGRINPEKKDLPPMILPLKARQIIYRNKSKKTVKADLVKNNQLVSRMKYIKPNEEIYRVQILN